MPEITKQPVSLWDDKEGELICFRDDHSIADIARWAMSNQTEAEELHRILGEMLGNGQ